MMQRVRFVFWLVCWAVAGVIVTGPARAFCGFYVSPGEGRLFADATMVVLMRDGTRTVLNMQNDYQGPPQDFAMVVPVTQVLSEDDVHTLESGIFDRVDQLTAPRLVEYWEQDPCQVQEYYDEPMAAVELSAESADDEDYEVTVEASFAVGEYEIQILSAGNSSGLDAWLRDHKYNIPKGAEPVLRPYVQQGMKFFVAKVNTKKVKFENGRAKLSPLRFHFDSVDFTLPVRLGLLNSQGTQDLIVVILAKQQRYEVANYPNVTIPTNIEVTNETRERFGEFYAALFDATLKEHPGAVVTEYSWAASTCDPCPTPPLTLEDMLTLGGDALPNIDVDEDASALQSEFVVTRLHYRYSAESLGEDLFFRAATPISGGREIQAKEGGLEFGAQISEYNQFQGRYIIRHEWTGEVACEEPRMGIWGGPPGAYGPETVPAMNTAYQPRGKLQLSDFVEGDLELQVLKASGKPMDRPPKLAPGGCAGCITAGSNGSNGAATLLLLAALAVRRRYCA